MSTNHNLLVKAKHVPELEAGTFFNQAIDAKTQRVANKMITILLKAGYSYDEMIPVLRLARRKHKTLKFTAMKNTKIYIAGKVTGLDYQQCFNKFKALDDTLSGFGFQVINPMRIVPNGTPWQEAMDILKPHLINSNVAVFMPDWIDSQGSIEERSIAMAKNIRIVEYDEMFDFIKTTCLA